jgi:hypothetical protein
VWTKTRRAWRLRFREDVQDEEEDDAVPFPRSGEVEDGHGDGGGRRKLRAETLSAYRKWQTGMVRGGGGEERAS